MLLILFTIFSTLALMYTRPRRAWVVAVLSSLLLLAALLGHIGVMVVLSLVFLPVIALITLPSFRRRWLSQWVYTRLTQVMPRLSDTERVALEAGTVSWEAECFRGAPNWLILEQSPLSKLSAEEQAFLDGPVDRLCQAIDVWGLAMKPEVPENIWTMIRQERFFGMIIPKCYGGLGFSAYGHARVIEKIASISTAVATLVCVPNSLGPAELLHRYGTEAQKSHYLPRLARAETIPCFGLTSPVAGSDATAIVDTGVVCMAMFNGEVQRCIRLNWEKRYITLSPVATLIGLAFKCVDPDGLLSDVVDRGITCALVPADLPGISVGTRHYPLYSAFPNGPVAGVDVIIPLDAVIGGEDYIGCGWKMLMECLSAGRAISLPSIASGVAKKALLTTGAYAHLRRQFHCSLTQFEGVQTLLARMVAQTVLTDAALRFSTSLIDQGERPSLISAICKVHTTEMSRQVLLQAMDIQAGKAICMGPKNFVAQAFIESPIAITVEGANLLSRSLIIFGQGAIRCHPYWLKEMEAVAHPDAQQGLHAFDEAFWSHAAFIGSQWVRALLSSWKYRFQRQSSNPQCTGKAMVNQFSAALSFVAEVVSWVYGADLKRREFMSARLGDILSHMVLVSSITKQLESSVTLQQDAIYRWIIADQSAQCERHLVDVINNLPARWARALLTMTVMPLGRCHSSPPDHLTSVVAKAASTQGWLRETLLQQVCHTPSEHNVAGQLYAHFSEIVEAEPLLDKIRTAKRGQQIVGEDLIDLAQQALECGILTAHEHKRIVDLHHKSMEFIHVDDFTQQELCREQ